MCAPAVPGGWTGPVSFIDSPSKTAAACTGGYPTQELLANCSSPTCVEAFASPTCSSSFGPVPIPMACAQSLVQSAVQSLKFTAATPTCAPIGTPSPAGVLQQDPVTICCLPSS